MLTSQPNRRIAAHKIHIFKVKWHKPAPTTVTCNMKIVFDCVCCLTVCVCLSRSSLNTFILGIRKCMQILYCEYADYIASQSGPVWPFIRILCIHIFHAHTLAKWHMKNTHTHMRRASQQRCSKSPIHARYVYREREPFASN